ncbi:MULTISPECIES: BREX-1 system adenine-specific DNA-methyltransferase PglX [Bacillus cereus group]|uniref:BREX-1 system adenine-specific DNA-methyltransferase PglX n=1 Tax=Bacillus cereus group TaxID=86661 RepID=UPI000873089C|nr:MULTISPECIES: BREX-1 system adenine-specific DNA-methyltransferase PglX [Bacillus cereus group]OFD57542.1 hypothetical protein BWGOE6_37120 [Bacillus mycoides]QWG48147.1 BREX-1 system adenine-specific DNA-methyltransferase PglX [Bacillus mycoides]WJE23060.1 BREX-1 system adenine-specific DNA-methyltransferase PglX [Bacillus cereus]
MNKSAMKTFATSARKELLKKVEAKALKIGITEDHIKKADVESSDAIFIDGRQLSREEKTQRDKLISRINQVGFKQVMEEVAYTWFNRFTALRFMEVNDYLPTGVRVLSSSNPNSTEPDMLNEALELDLEVGLDREHIYELKLSNKTEELFKYLIIKHCNDLNRFLHFMFEPINDYTEFLFPEGMLAKDSFIRHMTDLEIIPESDWEEVEIIGWLYQYYNTELNEIVYDGNMSKSRIPKELLPAATQLFTPDWAVKYMVENSVGRLWLHGHPNSHLQESWKYYLANGEEPHKFEQIESIKSQFSHINPEEIKVFDPCMGSGHILVYAFEVLMEIYITNGYIPREAAKLILQKNLYGLEIDDRAYQLSCFSVLMKARKYNRRIFDEKIELNLCSITESNEIGDLNIKDVVDLEAKDIETANYLLYLYKNAKEYGSILNIDVKDYASLFRSIKDIETQEIRDLFQTQLLIQVNEIMPKLIKQAQIMTQQYDVVITNPPYLGNSRMSPLLNDYVKENFPNTKSDLSMVMYQKAIESYSKPGGIISFITTTSWMFLGSFEAFRKKVINTLEFCSLVDFGTELFDGKVGHNPIAAWVNRVSKPTDNMTVIRLVDYCYSKRDQKETEYFNQKNRYYLSQERLTNIPGTPFAYWLSNPTIFNQEKLGDHFFSGGRNKTHNNQKYLRYFWEVSFVDSKWVSYLNGGEFKRYYGNDIFVVNWSDEAREFYASHGGLVNPKFWNKEGITWNLITSAHPGFRVKREKSLYSSGSPTIFNENYEVGYSILGFLNSKVAKYLLKLLNPTLNTTVGDVLSLPHFPNTSNLELVNLVKENIELAKDDWDNFEISTDFQNHPLLRNDVKSCKLSDSVCNLTNDGKIRFSKMKSNDEEINKKFIDLFSLQNDLDFEVTDSEITLNVFNNEKAIRTFISYFIGCIFGRYSLDEDGLIYAGGKFDLERYKTFKADKDNILPILDGSYFNDDIVSKFIEFVQVTFGEETLAENLNFIANTIGKKKGETAKETFRRYFLNDFFKDHCQTYKKRPIYWLFTSGKQKAFNCLIYMQRYDKTTLSRIRTDYLHDYQIRLDAEKKDLLSIIEGDYSAKEISNAKKELKALDKKIEELKEYDELLHHMADKQIEIDLDDGVVNNYEMFKGLVAKI